jgi:hypothetical protein
MASLAMGHPARVRLPDLLTATDLPEPELHALRLDGVLYVVAGSWRPSDLPETTEARADAVALVLRDRLIADRLTAAWLLAAADRAPLPLQCCAAVDDRGAAGSDGLDIRELRLEARDVTRVGRVRLTTPLRTATDLLRGAGWGVSERQAVARLAAICGTDAVGQALEEPRFAAHRRRAVRRLHEVVGPGAVVESQPPSPSAPRNDERAPSPHRARRYAPRSA